MARMKDLYTDGVRDLHSYFVGKRDELQRVIELLTDLDVIRRDAFGHLVAFNTYGTEVIYLTGLEGTNTKVSGGDFPTDSASSALPISQEEMKTFHCSKCPMTVKVLGFYADLYLRCPNCTSVLIKGEK